MKKFPVTSIDGNEYLAEVSYTHYIIGKVLAVNIYVEKEYKSLWRTKTKLVKVFESYFEEDDEEYHDVVKAVKYCVSAYEANHKKNTEKKLYHENLMERSKKEFEEWDGKCQ